MIVKSTLQELKDCLEPARDQMDWKDPKIWMVEPGIYKVQGSNGHIYDVTCGRNEFGKFFVACTCTANLHWKHCYHALRAFEAHVSVMTEIKSKKGT